MTDQEREELHRFIAIRVMGWTRAKSEHEVEYYVESHEWCANYTPTTNPAQAMAVLEKCAEMLAPKMSVLVSKTDRRWIVETNLSGEYCSIGTNAETLPEAICLFARELFK